MRSSLAGRSSLVLTGLLVACTGPPTTPIPAVGATDVFVGTGGVGYGAGATFPGPTMPFGMVRLGPDTDGGDFNRSFFAHFGGYFYGDPIIEGFSHTHLEGVGDTDFGNVTLMPTLGMSAAKTSFTGYAATFSHDHEDASPGYYRVTLDDGIRAELTATLHAGVHRYTFPPGTDHPVVLLDLGHTLAKAKVLAGEIHIVPDEQRVRGWLLDKGAFTKSFGGVRIYFDAKLSRPWIDQGTWLDGKMSAHATTVTAPSSAGGHGFGAYLVFPGGAGATQVEARVGLSFVSAEDAQENRVKETAGKSFDDLAAAAAAAWARELGRIQVEGGTSEQRRIFYSALYHVFQMPTLYSDVNGDYRFLGKNRTANGFRFYSDMSLWDTYRTAEPLITLIAPGYQRDFVRSLVAMGLARGAFPRWPTATGDAGFMVGTPADIVVAGSYLKGIRGFDVETAYNLMKKSATLGDSYAMRAGLSDYLDLGYVPSQDAGGSVSVTLECMYADFALSRLAAALGKTDDASMFAARAARYPKLFDTKTGFFRARKRDGSWATTPFRDTAFGGDYIEGDAWQYLWAVPWDEQGLAALLGGTDAALTKLDHFFALSRAETPTVVSGIRFPDQYYWQGNEPDINAPYVYAALGHPERGAPQIRWIQQNKYTDRADGLDGNDDGGTLSAWYVWSAIGLYPVPATTHYLIGSPLFSKVVLDVGGGRHFTILAPGASSKAMYVRRALLDGAPIDHPWIDHKNLAAGGTLELDMSTSPP